MWLGVLLVHGKGEYLAGSTTGPAVELLGCVTATTVDLSRATFVSFFIFLRSWFQIFTAKLRKIFLYG